MPRVWVCTYPTEHNKFPCTDHMCFSCQPLDLFVPVTWSTKFLSFYKKLKNLSFEYDWLNGWNSTLKAAWYIRHVRWASLFCVSFTKCHYCLLSFRPYAGIFFLVHTCCFVRVVAVVVVVVFINRSSYPTIAAVPQQYPQCPSWYFILGRYKFCGHKQRGRDKTKFAEESIEANQALAYRVREHNQKTPPEK